MKRLLLLWVVTMVMASLSLAQVTSLAKYQFTKAIIVDVKQAWTSTGISIEAGDTVEISAKGVASTAAGNDIQYPAWLGPEGSGEADGLAPAGFNVPGGAAYCLIGKIGASGQGFFIGAGRVFQSNAAGELFLGYNDDPTNPGAWADNFGYFVAWVAARSVISPVGDVLDESSIPKSISVSQNYPNPFNPATTIDFQMPGRSNVSIAIYNAAGQQVRTLLNEYRDAGTYSIVWDGKRDDGVSLASGAYFTQVTIGNFAQTKKMLLLK